MSIAPYAILILRVSYVILLCAIMRTDARLASRLKVSPSPNVATTTLIMTTCYT